MANSPTFGPPQGDTYIAVPPPDNYGGGMVPGVVQQNQGAGASFGSYGSAQPLFPKQTPTTLNSDFSSLPQRPDLFKQEANPGTSGLGYIQSLGQSGLSALGGGLGTVVTGLGSAVISGLFSERNADVAAEATRYSADKTYSGIKYNADQVYNLGSKALGQQQMQWQTDWDAARTMGLISPSQFGSMGSNGKFFRQNTANSTISSGFLTKGNSPFG